MKIAILGGDKREKIMSELLYKKGYEIIILSDIIFSNKDIKFYKDYKNVIKDAELIYLPLSGVDENNCVKSTFTTEEVKLDNKFISDISEKSMVLIGVNNDSIKKMFAENNISYIEMNKLADLAILNAIPTAEGAIKIAIEKTPYTIFESEILITGLGKVGMTLAWRLKALGANVYVATRDKKAISRGRDFGFKMIDYTDLEKYLAKINIIYNTVPAKIITERYLRLLTEDTLIVDLASSPGGVDFETAKELGIEAFLAPGLPGKIAPETAAKILADKVDNIICEHFK